MAPRFVTVGDFPERDPFASDDEEDTEDKGAAEGTAEEGEDGEDLLEEL